jgi:hypothetical protein
MDNQKIAKDMVEFNKSLFDNTFDAISSIQDQSGKMFASFVEKAAWMPDDGKKAINNWISTYKKGCEDFKAKADERYEKAASYFTQTKTK